VGSEKNQSHTSQEPGPRSTTRILSPSLLQPSRSFRAAAAETLAASPASGSSSPPPPPTPDRSDLETVEPRWRTGVSTSLSRLSILRNSLPEFAARFDSSSLCSRCASRDVTLKRLPNLGKQQHFCVKTILQEDFTN
jgi:hypothetical protein